MSLWGFHFELTFQKIRWMFRTVGNVSSINNGISESTFSASSSSAATSFAAAYEVGLISVFTDLSELFGNPRSYGQIYGLLFASEEPLTGEEIGRRLGISRGSISQGLRQLEAFGAIIREKNNGVRQARYRAKLEMKLLISGFLKERAIPRLETTEARIKTLQHSLAALTLKSKTQVSSLSSMRFRLDRLAKWHRSARTLLPIARKILGGD